MEFASLRFDCALLERPIRPSRCTELLLERFGVTPSLAFDAARQRLGLSRKEANSTCRSCPFNPVEDGSREGGSLPVSAHR